MKVVGALPLPAPHFVPRAQIGQLRAALARERVAVVVCGMRGAGKTQVAAAYARQVMADPATRLVGWIGAETRDSALAGLAAVAAALGVADPEGDSLVSARRLRDHLNSTPVLSGVLVFDNATDPDFLNEFLPTGGGVRVVITSTDRAFTGLGELVDAATGYDRIESVTYLAAATGLDDPAGADALAAEVGDLPLALAAAATTITTRRLDYPGYRELLAAQPLPDALPRQRGTGYDRATDQALGLAIDTVTTTGETALDERVRWLVGVLAMLSPDGVEAALLERKPDPVTGVAIGRCVEGSLLSWATGGRVLVMHRLTGRVVRERALAAGTLDGLIDAAATLLEPHLFDRSEAFQRRGDGTRLIDHIETLTGHAAGLPTLSPATDAAVLATRRWAIGHLIGAADLRRAISYAEHAVTDHQRVLGDDHPDTLTTRHNLAYAYQTAGRVGEAIELYERLLTDRRRVLGDDHPNTLATRHNLAGTYETAGRVGEAIELYERVLTDNRRVLGDDNPNTLITRNQLAGAYETAGRVGEAIELYERLLTDRRRVLGDDHPNTLTTRNNLAFAYRAAGRVGEAIELYERLLTDNRRVLGDDHPNTLTTRHNLAFAYRAAGRVGEAIELYERVLTDRRRVLGDDHPNTLTTRHNLAGTYETAGRVGEAIELFERVLTDRRRVLGDDHPNTLTTRNNLAYTYETAGRVGEAIELYERLLTDNRRVLGDDHPNTLTTRDQLAAARKQRGSR
ncbi:tetratricopeptide repeat protein [Nocardia sp. NPDC057227]|uniref:tetratricopeptide repeat protein n=1 Tax=Nocardia sp. NPDC057227 TaxID=3346056 RepID=UPI00363ACFE2